MLLKDYLRNTINEMRNTISAKCTIYRTTFGCDIIDCETGEIYFSGDISWIVPEFVNDTLVFDSTDDHGHTVYFKRVH
jgi:hypothetical protein